MKIGMKSDLERGATLTAEQQQALLDIARRAIRESLTPSARAEVPGLALPHASGVFVTVKVDGELRGCLGTFECDAGLAREVARCAVDAASRDPRFPPIAIDELDRLSLDVSILGTLERVQPPDPSAIEVGRHGLVVEQGRYRGLLLPQVAVEWGWRAEQFLQHTCLKAGLARDAWRHGATVYRFDAQVFGD